MADSEKTKYRETLLVIVLGFSILSLILHLEWMLISALAIGVLGMLSMSLNRWIHVAWFFLGEKLGFVVSKILLGTIFYLLVLPMGGLSRLFRKDVLNLRSPHITMYHLRDHLYDPEDFENMW